MAEDKKKSFEAALQALEAEVASLEQGELSLEDSLRCFESGVKNVTLCRQHLQAVELRVEKLLKDRDGALRTENFEED
ncbi:MAG: exodeoxyribonuclease VII small subunit [Desulfuromonadales bacterium]|jgi:exodeoxyribonuclease VII small subunit